MNDESSELQLALLMRQSIIDRERRAEAALDAAQALLKQKDYKGALRAFKKYYQHYDDDDPFGISTKDVAVLVKNYEPARLVVRRWRNDKEKIILQGKADRKLVDQWISLNEALKEKERTESVYRKLKDSRADDDVLEPLVRHLWRQLVRVRRYEEVRLYFHSLGFFLLLHITEFDCSVLFPGHRGKAVRGKNPAIEQCLRLIIQDGPPTYELALGLGEVELARQFARRMLRVETSDRVYAALIGAAIHAGAFAQGVELYAEAKATLGSRRIRKTNKVFCGVVDTKFRLPDRSRPG
ncbi:MAG TPA: hypothetical protein PLC15_17860 [Candidatus Obscuribacter sp.]|nr:hypothetical protein [Candidatus Obscuribacter sp.]